MRYSKYLVLWAVAGSLANAQTIHVRLLNANSGVPLGKRFLRVEWEESGDTGLISIDSSGEGNFALPPGVQHFVLSAASKSEQEPYRLAFVNCNKPVLATIDASQVIKQGLVPENGCGGAVASVKPGEVVFWAKPRRWWQFDFQ